MLGGRACAVARCPNLGALLPERAADGIGDRIPPNAPNGEGERYRRLG